MLARLLLRQVCLTFHQEGETVVLCGCGPGRDLSAHATAFNPEDGNTPRSSRLRHSSLEQVFSRNSEPDDTPVFDPHRPGSLSLGSYLAPGKLVVPGAFMAKDQTDENCSALPYCGTTQDGGLDSDHEQLAGDSRSVSSAPNTRRSKMSLARLRWLCMCLAAMSNSCASTASRICKCSQQDLRSRLMFTSG